jgi:polyisoprenoid-binding protein YceI
MKPDALNSLLVSGQPHHLIHVLPEEIHEACHIPGSSCACVFETAFPGRVRELVPQSDAMIVLYGAGDGSCDSRAAAEKLHAAGYSNVMVLDGGITAWRDSGYPVKGHGNMPEEPVINGVYQVNAADSLIRWTGRNLFNHHSGTVKLRSGEITAVNGVLTSARFEIDMNSIACEDLTDQTWNDMLIRHLHDVDFFLTSLHPTALFVVDSAEAITGATEGTPNFILKGSLTLRGFTKSLELPAVIATADGARVTGQAQIEIDRTEFGSIYGSSRFFRFLGKHVVNDHIQLHLKVHADRDPML